MAPRIPRFTAKEAEESLSQCGFVLIAEKGGHRKWKNPANGAQVVVPTHSGRPLPLRTLHYIQYGLEPRQSLLAPIALLLMCSGACALIYQVAWFREFSLVFGSTTAATAAVVAIFMGGLGIGNALLGKRADQQQNPLMFYARLEFGIAAIASITPFLIAGIRQAYIGLGGQMSLGVWGATPIRLALSALVLLLPTILMGGTLPAAVAAATNPKDLKRRAAGLLYGCNTLGAVAGTLASTFVLLSWIGTRSTLWWACILNFIVALSAASLARLYSATSAGQAVLQGEVSTGDRHVFAARKLDYPPPGRSILPPSFSFTCQVYAAAAIVGFAFMLMELVWYRMLAPLLGGTTYTFGLILAMALLGIGIGGAIYPLLFNRRFTPSLTALSLTCGLEAVLIALPFALGDRIASQAAIMHLSNTWGFKGEIMGWAKIAALVVLPASIVSGVQFPLLLALLGRSKQNIGKHLGYTYLANTCGGILGSLSGGFGLLPLLSATGAWRMVVVILTALSAAFALTTLRTLLKGKTEKDIADIDAPSSPGSGKESAWNTILSGMAGLVVGLLALGLVSFPGPSAFWRHSGIGAGRGQVQEKLTPNNLQNWKNQVRRQIVWQTDGVEAGVAITVTNGMSFIINGKSDGNSLGDAPMQVGMGMLAAFLHPAPKTCLVVGLGTGETTGWLAQVPTVKKVDVVEIEPAVAEMARRCAAVNYNALENPKVNVIYNDAREMLLTCNNRYDIIASEPSNPYRAGIANLFTREFYLSVSARLNRGGLFVQWLQGYEIDGITVATVIATLKSVFPNVEVWETGNNDLLLLCSQQELDYNLERVRERLREEPFQTAFREIWRITKPEGFFAHYVGGKVLVEALAKQVGHVQNTDDFNRLEYGFARTLGRATGFSILQLREKALVLSADRPQVGEGQVAWEEVEDEKMSMFFLYNRLVPLPPGASSELACRGKAISQFSKGNYKEAVSQWESQPNAPATLTEIALLGVAYAEIGNEKALELIDRLRPLKPCEADLIHGILLVRLGKDQEACETFSQAFVALRHAPWTLRDITGRVFEIVDSLSRKDKTYAQKMLQALEKPFAAMYMETERRWLCCLVSVHVDFKNLLSYLEGYEPLVPWQEDFLQIRAETYKLTGNPLQGRAERDLQLFRSQEPKKDVDNE